MRISSPVAEFSGEVAGVVFIDGVATTEDPAALAYFRRRGYRIGDESASQQADSEAPIEETEQAGGEAAEVAAPAKAPRKSRGSS